MKVTYEEVEREEFPTYIKVFGVRYVDGEYTNDWVQYLDKKKEEEDDP